MSANWTFVTSRQVWEDQSLSTAAKVIWHILSGFRNHVTGEAFPSIWTMQQLSGMGRHKVERGIAELVKAGAINKKVIRIRGKQGLAGAQCHYTVSKLSDWKARQPYDKTWDSGYRSSRDRISCQGPVTVSQSQTLTQSQTISYSRHPSMADTGFKPTEEETETLLVDRGFEREAQHVVFRLVANNWRDSSGRPFTSRANFEAYAVGLAEKMEETRGF